MQNKHQFFFLVLGVPTFGERGGKGVDLVGPNSQIFPKNRFEGFPYAAWGEGATIPAAGGKGAEERGGTSAPPHTQFAHYSAGAVLVVSTRRQSQVTPWLKIRENSCAVLSGEPCYLGQR